MELSAGHPLLRRSRLCGRRNDEVFVGRDASCPHTERRYPGLYEDSQCSAEDAGARPALMEPRRTQRSEPHTTASHSC